MKSIVHMMLAAATARRTKLTLMGLTLIELAVVIALLAIIAAILLPVFA
jgi:prepilin-type N-terminal cleavage/methylation domain-containing protein